MKTVILLIAIATASIANAANCFKHPKKCAKSADRRARQARDVAIDIVTAGHTKRERERQEADKKREQAEQAKKFAEENLKNSIKNKKLEISNIEQQLLFIDFMEESIAVAKDSAAIMSPLLEQLYLAYQTDQLRSKYIQEIIKLQNASLTNFVKYKLVPRSAENNQNLQDRKRILQDDLETFTNQINALPVQSSNPEDIEAWLSAVEEKSYEILNYCSQTLNWLQSERERLTRQKSASQKDLEILSSTTPIASKPEVTVSPSQIAQPKKLNFKRNILLRKFGI